MFDSARYAAPWVLSGALPPLRIVTPRLVLRCWESGDAPLFESAFEPSREHVGAWIPPARSEPAGLHLVERRLEKFRAEFLGGVGFVYAIFDLTESEVLGEIGLMPRVGPHALEIGYWIRGDRVGRGFATEATRALTVAALALPDVDRIEIHCDPRNAPSAAVPRKLGYRLVDVPLADVERMRAPASDVLVFQLAAEDEIARGGGGPS